MRRYYDGNGRQEKLKRINPVKGKEIDQMFDGHLEKPLLKMTPTEKLHYLWLQTVFKWKADKAKKDNRRQY